MTGGSAPRLARTLRLHHAVGIGLGAMVGAGVFVVWAPAAAAAGSWLLLALAVAALVAVCNALSSAALAARYPSAGGAYVYGRERLGELPGFLAGWCFVVGKTASCAAMAMAIAEYVAPGHQRWAAAGAVVVVTGLALAGVRRSALVSSAIALTVLALVAVLAVLALSGASAGVGEGFSWDRVADVGRGASLAGGLQAAALIFFAFAGYARIATLAEEVVEPARTIPRAVVLTLVVVLTTYAVVAVLVLGVLGLGRLTDTPAPLAEVGALLAGPTARGVMAATAAVAAAGALLNLMLGISRTSLAMARGGHLPPGLARIGGRGVPYVAELGVAAVVLIVVMVADLRGAIGFSSFGVLLYYALANASAWTLRGDWRWARLVPVAGLAGCLVLAFSLPWASVLGGLVVIAIGLGWFAVTKRAENPSTRAG